MDKLEHYRGLVRQILREYYELGKKSTNSTRENFLIFDEQHDHYLLIVMGWQGEERIKVTTIHARLCQEKIWIEEDCTEDGVVTDFLQLGIPREDLVLAFHPPHLRQYTEFLIPPGGESMLQERLASEEQRMFVENLANHYARIIIA